MPGKMAWATASPKKAIPRNTMYVPTKAHTMPTIVVANSPRIMKGYSRGVII
jgi:hypothetical protein